MSRNFILEYSEHQGCFHYNFGQNKPNTNTYYTIRENCTLEYMDIFDSYIDNKFGKPSQKRELTVDGLKKCVDELEILMQSIKLLNLESEQQ
jgi:hypothetical protein